jgi:hypothetical protein
MITAKAVSIVESASATALGTEPIGRAIAQLVGALKDKNIQVHSRNRLDQVPEGELCILIADTGSQEARQILSTTQTTVLNIAESLALVRGNAAGRTAILASGTDMRGIVYAILELADRVAHSENAFDALARSLPIVEQPANTIRSIARLFTSEVEDKTWFYDRGFWKDYLSMLIAQRFNRFSLSLGLGYNFPRNVSDVYFYFAYPYLVSVPGYDVRISGLADEERDRNMDMLRFIGEETVANGLQFQLALWTHAYEWVDSPNAHAKVEGLTAETHAPYCRDALNQILNTCPTLSGITFRIHGESGVPEESYEFWQTVFDGIVQCGRPIEIDMHAKGLDQKMIAVAHATHMPIVVSPKYWAEHQGLPYHQAAIRDQEQAPSGGGQRDFMAFSAGSRRFLRYSYGDLLREDRAHGELYRIWPGTQRHLLWGDPAQAAGLGRYAGFCGGLGLELFEPLTFKGRMGSGVKGGREGYLDESLRSKTGDWEKFGYTYRLMGRLLYNPDAEPDTWQRYLKTHFGRASEAIEKALANASRILPLVTLAHHPSASNNSFWTEMYTNMPIVDPDRTHPYRDTRNPKCFGTVSPLDPAMFSSIDEYVSDLVMGKPSPRYSPLTVADWLEACAETAETEHHKSEGLIADAASPAYRRVAIDVAIQAGLGHFFADKLRAGVSYVLWQKAGNSQKLSEALSFYRRARDAWARLSETASVYAQDLTYGQSPHLRGHWVDRLQAIDDDILDMEKQKVEGKNAGVGSIEEIQRGVPHVTCSHTPPESFSPGESLTLNLLIDFEEQDALSARLHCRHISQSEFYDVIDMQLTDHGFSATISSDYTDSPYPLQYWFELCHRSTCAWFWPGLDTELSNQPYFVVRQPLSKNR